MYNVKQETGIHTVYILTNPNLTKPTKPCNPLAGFCTLLPKIYITDIHWQDLSHRIKHLNHYTIV